MINFHPNNGNAEPRPRITVIGVGGAGGNAVNNMIISHLEGVEFVVANTDAQALAQSRTDRRIQLGGTVTQGLGAGARPDVGRAAAEETIEEVMAQLAGSNMAFITAGMGGGTGTGAAPVIARAAREHGILTVGVVTKPFHFEGAHRMRLAEQGIEELSQYVDTLIIIPNQNLFRIASDRTTFADAFKMADDVLYSGVRGVTDLMVMPGLINLDFADIRTVMSEMGKAMMGTGEAEGEERAKKAAEAAISNPLLDDVSMKGAKGVLINITGGPDITLFEVDEAAHRIRSEVDADANIIFGSTFDEKLEGRIRISVVATGIEIAAEAVQPRSTVISLVEPRRPAATVTAIPPKGPTLADRVASAERAAAERIFPGTPTTPVLHQPMEAERAPVQFPQASAEAAAGGVAEAPAAVIRPEIVPPAIGPMRGEATATLRQEPSVSVRPQPTARTSEPVQGNLGIEAPTPRAEMRAEVRGDAATATLTRPAAPPAPAPTEVPRRPGGFISRLAGHVRNSPYGQAMTAQQAEPPARTEPAPAAAAPQPTRISPADRLPTSRSTEDDLLDIPAFLRRQAN